MKSEWACEALRLRLSFDLLSRNGRGEPLKQSLDVLPDLVARPVLFRDVFPHDPPVFDDKGLRILECSIFGADGRVRIAVGVESQAEVVEKALVLLGIFVDANPKNDHALVAKLPLKLIQRRSFGNAGRSTTWPRS